MYKIKINKQTTKKELKDRGWSWIKKKRNVDDLKVLIELETWKIRIWNWITERWRYEFDAGKSRNFGRVKQKLRKRYKFERNWERVGNGSLVCVEK